MIRFLRKNNRECNILQLVYFLNTSIRNLGCCFQILVFCIGMFPNSITCRKKKVKFNFDSFLFLISLNTYVILSIIHSFGHSFIQKLLTKQLFRLSIALLIWRWKCVPKRTQYLMILLILKCHSFDMSLLSLIPFPHSKDDT